MAAITRFIESQNYFLIQDDLVSAFDHIRIDDAIELFRELGASDLLLRLLRKILEKTPNASIGIGQGDALSPLALNLVLNEKHDQILAPIVADGNWIRYVDNLFYFAKSRSQACEIYEHAREILADSGFSLKALRSEGLGSVFDLRETGAEVLGFRIQTLGRQLLQIQLSDNAWRVLAAKLLNAHEFPDPIARANAETAAWLDSRGPALPVLADPLLARVRDLLARNGFRELAGSPKLYRWYDRAVSRWNRTLARSAPANDASFFEQGNTIADVVS